MVDIDFSLDEIDYNAWGTPFYTGDIEGLSILWNGYYYDHETGNYYLRNRYYSPLERRFITDDPHGINPDETWRNSFGPWKQYRDGYSLDVYAEADPINNFDPWGLWHYAKPAIDRSKESRTFVVASGYWEMMHNIKALAKMVRLNEEQFDKWGKRAIHKVNGIKKCGAWVPNTAYVHKGDVSGKIGSKGGATFVNLWTTKRLNAIAKYYESKGYNVEQDNDATVSEIEENLKKDNIIAWAFGGHGHKDHGWLEDSEGEYMSATQALLVHHKISNVIIYSCYAGKDNWYKILSKYGTIRITDGNLWIAFTDWNELPEKGRSK